jgi:hypothetical protein
MSKISEIEMVNQTPSIWGPITVLPDEISVHWIGPLKMLFKRLSNEIWIAIDRSQVEHTNPDDLDWSRWAIKKEDFSIELLPLMPDKQVVVRPEHPFNLASGAKATIFTRIPVWVGIYTNESKRHKLTEIASLTLNKTWFGDFLDGVLCYWVATTARRKVTDDIFQPHTVITTLNIKNESDQDLTIDKLSLLVERLSLYEKKGQLWTDEMDIVYNGEDNQSEITMTGKPPQGFKDAKLISTPRNPQRKSFTERTFKILKEIPGFS